MSLDILIAEFLEYMEIEKGCKAFITGAASGIGRSTAIAMGRLGARLFLTDINEKDTDFKSGYVSIRGNGFFSLLRS